MTTNKDIYATVQDASQYDNVIASLQKGAITWQETYWGAKYIIERCADKLNISQKIDLLNRCFSFGLNLLADKEAYIDVHTKLSRLYLENHQYELSVNCSLALIDISEDMPPEVFLNLVEAEIYTDTLKQTIKNSVMFFADLHIADKGNEESHNRQVKVVKAFLRLAADFLMTQKKYQVDEKNIEKEIVAFKLTESEEWKYFCAALTALKTGTKTSITTPKVITPEINEAPSKVVAAVGTNANVRNTGDSTARPFIISISPEDKSSKTPPAATATLEKPTVENVNSSDASSNAVVPPKVQATPAEKEETSIAELFANFKTEFRAELRAELLEELRREEEKKTRDARDVAILQARLEEEERARLAVEHTLKSTKSTIDSLRSDIAARDATIEAFTKHDFTTDELEQLSQYKRIIVFDTCAIMHEPNLVDYFDDDDCVRVPILIGDELDHINKRNPHSEDAQKARVALRSLNSVAVSFGFKKEQVYPELVPVGLDNETNDNLILSVAIRYQKYANRPVVLIVDDNNFTFKADDILTYTACDFITAQQLSKRTVSGELNQRQIDYLAQPLKASYGITPQELQVFKQNGILTYGDFMNQTEQQLAQLGTKRVKIFVAHLLQAQKKIKIAVEHMQDYSQDVTADSYRNDD